MENVVQFYVDDTSPVISYSPFGDTFTTPNLGAGWNPYFNLSGFAASIGEVGNGTSLHITSLNGASLGFQWRGTAIQLQGNATLASYSITIDGQTIPMANQTDIDNNILANIEGLEDADHNITLTAQIPEGQNPPNSSMLVFDKAVITSTPILVSSNVSFRLDTIQDNDISFRGRWSFVNTSTGVSVHSSSTAGDRALTTFNGTTFLLRGMTSPDAAEYSVNLDNVTTTYSARSSFTDNESLLFFASGLDQNLLHSVEVRNLNGGDLSLLVGGFSTFTSYNPPPSPTSSATTLPSTSGSSSSMSFSKGTIAAFILAGILAFLLITAVLLFFLWYRPRMRRRRYECRLATTRFDQSPSKAHEAGGVINISTSGEPHYDKAVDLEDASPVDDDQQHSQLSGFARWRREAVHGSFGGVSLPLHFRHSDSANGKSRTRRDTIEERPRSEMSDPPSTESSARRKARTKSKGKARQITGRSWSPSYTLDLPLQQKPTTRASNGQGSARVTSVGQLSSFVAADPSPQDLRNPAPPSYAASVSNRDSIQNSNMSGTNTNPSSSIPSGPRSVSYSPVIADDPITSHHHHHHPLHQPHHRDNSNGFLLHEGEPSSDPESPGNDYPHLQLTPPEPEGIPMRPLARYDTGSLTTEDNPSIIEPKAMREVLRTLSPRTSEAPRLSEWHDEEDNQTSLIASPITIASSTPPPDVQPTSEQSQSQSQSQPKPKPKIKPLPRPPIQTKTDEDEVEVRDGVFLSVRATSPFQVDFDSRSASQQRAAASDETSDMYTTASSSRNPSRQSSGLRRLPEPSGAAGTATITRIPEFIQGTSRLPFRLTPMAFPMTQTPPKQSSDGTSDGVTSFLDLTSSREGSMRSRSIRTGTAGSELDRPMNEVRLSVPGVGAMEPKSRWSNTTVPSIATNLLPPAANNTSSGESQHHLSPSDARSTDSSTFPIAVQVDIPPSPHHIMDFAPSRQSDTSRRTSGFTQAGDHLHIHPALESLESPTESIPMSVSEVHFRHSDSEEASPSTQARPNLEPQSSSFHPTHPPLPGSQGEEYTPRPFDPSVLVSRVLGLSSTAPSVDLSRSGSTAAPPSASTHTFPPRSNPNTSNDQLNPPDKSGHQFS